MASWAIVLGCASHSKAEECDYSSWNPIEVKPEKIVGKYATYNPKTHRAVTPVYPKEARAKRASGTVNVRVLIDPNGKALKTCAVILPGEPEVDKSLIDAALANVKKWKFRSLQGRIQVFRQTTIQLKFALASL